MNILFISYWGINDGLTKATVIPHLNILDGFTEVQQIILVTIERDLPPVHQNINNKTQHIPISSRGYNLFSLDKIFDFIRIPTKLKNICDLYKIDKIMARGAPAGSLAYLTWKKNKIPYYVESFEPHSSYMLETGVWKKWSIRYLTQKYWETKQCQTAKGLMPVSEEFSILLKSITDKTNIQTVPCAVNSVLFKFDLNKRILMREKLGIEENSKVGIYVGKFGGLYLDLDDLSILKGIYDNIENVALIILSPTPAQIIKKALVRYGINHNIYIKSVDHSSVPDFLSASDFALSLNKSFPSGKYLSPIKIGEYWANGLPILLTKGIGDESNFLEIENGGVLFDINAPETAIKKLEKLLMQLDYRIKIPELAKKYRSLNQVKKAYINLILD